MSKKKQESPKKPLLTWLAGEQIPALLAKTGNILSCAAVHECYREGNPSAVDSILASMSKGHATLNQAYLAVLGGDNSQTALRDDTRAKLVMDVYHFGNWVEIMGRENPAALLNTGYLSAGPVVRHRVPPPLDAPATGLVLSHGPHTGSGYAKYTYMKGVKCSELWYTCKDPAFGENWSFLKSGVGTKLEFDGLEPGKLYYFRLRGINARGAGPWSTVVSLRAI
ncbi:fibronectin type III domain-containing protein [Geomonas sp. Red32]|uniref:fibronectin type III domain-containing protein n=1 Tax=Geomonas sp. Red32 TaxID=2912856 RepID=UPI00202CBFEE|nr:fibronectin type III domain-containing protein [Geomonas sp. Red32]MCM0082767.1 fibronectin type III domain-containing protein [Geomonas sp. Red32]